MEWTAQWRFERVGHELYGREGAITVIALDKRQATTMVKDQAARTLFAYWPERHRDFVRVTKLEQARKRRKA